MTDPWLTQASESENTERQSGGEEFEDNFASLNNSTPESSTTQSNSNDHKPLPDSESYLQGLERKLEKIKKGTTLIEALVEKRQDCMRALLNEEADGIQNNNDHLLELDTPIETSIQELYRHLQPVQPITIGETVHILCYDQLHEQSETAENAEDETETPDY